MKPLLLSPLLFLPLLLPSPAPEAVSAVRTASFAGGEPATFSVDPRHSNVFFRTKHVGVSYFYGRFNRITGELEYDPDSREPGSIFVSIESASVDTNDASRDKHLRSGDFFSAKEYPAIEFESTSVAVEGEDLAVTGKLTFHGVTKEVSCTVRPTGAGEALGAYRIGFETELEIDMREFGVSFVKKNPGAVGPEVLLRISLECTRN